eukprot:CAMPEP_0119116188 /NCGR_PEP_ID=MMETSP1180-20130426/52147_1 /TAXON_ID=3052 ORGANISM="Chlamydomonas cf sp, Strain CCMP681" /NCGR_SAMPLE_ID=MMETSP1180 /ASSEMBLY_ACC=CAM_ASM_000741 /LENGTH=406 /DNA_ID=CAMNT_0007105309 /DNA_START=231 /DNA_END=1451 /DNA_ORIENTATION=-
MDDEYAVAVTRLADVLAASPWSEQEAVRAELASYSAAMKLTFLTNLGSLVAMVAVATCWIAHVDPFGGFTFTAADNLDAVRVGLLASLPLIAASVVLRIPGVRRAMPVIEDLHCAQAAVLHPLLKDMSPAQLVIATSSTMLPSLLLLLPAMHGLMSMLMGHLQSEPVAQVSPLNPEHLAGLDTGLLAVTVSLKSRVGSAAEIVLGGGNIQLLLKVGEEALAMAPSFISGFVAAYMVMRQLAPRKSQLAAIRDSLASSDRWFRLTLAMERGVDQPALAPVQTQAITIPHSSSSSSSSSSGSCNELQEENSSSSSPVTTDMAVDADIMPARVSAAFERLAILWLIARREVCRMAYILTACNVVLLAVLWESSSNLAAPATTILVAACVEIWLTQRDGDLQNNSKSSRQ